jgi:hypothetical protein
VAYSYGICVSTTIRIIDNPKTKKEFENIFTPKQNEITEPVVAAP